MSDVVLEALNRAAEEVTPDDIDTIIAFYRKTRAQFEAGIKPKKEGADIKIAINVPPPKASPGFKRRI